MHQRLILSIVIAIILHGPSNGNSSNGEYMQLSGVVHIHSTFSSGQYSLDELVSKAEEKGLEVLIVTDHDKVVMEYGVFPFRNLIKKREERPSVLKAGPQNYLDAIEHLNRRQQSVLVIPGVQSSPFYYWTGSPLGQGLTAHDFRKELLIVGMSESDDYNNLPLLHGPVSKRHLKELLPQFLIFLAAFLLSIYLIYQKGKMRIVGLLIAIFSLAMMVDQHPFKSSRYDPYHGDQGEAPYQETIDYARSRGGLVFWAHPESNYSKNGVQLGPVKLMTEHYPDALVKTEDYTGFAVIYGDSITATDAGAHWDQVLMQYCRGERAAPAWGIAGSDYHRDSGGVSLDTFQTVFLVGSKRPTDVMQALERGRVYAVRKFAGFRLSLDNFQIEDSESGQRVITGGEIAVSGSPLITGRLSATDNDHHDVTVAVVRGGKSVWSFEGQTPLDFRLVDPDPWSGKTFYRLDVSGKRAGKLLSNPIFAVRR